MATDSKTITSVPKATPRVALVSLPDSDCAILRDGFREFRVQPIILSGTGRERLKNEKFDGCVLPLDDEAAPLLEALRASPLNKRIVVYGICDGTDALLGFTQYGINVVLEHPLTKASAGEAIRATHLLVRGELRCYVRAPLVTAVTLTAKGTSTTVAAFGQEISAGGMSLKTAADLPLNQLVQLSLSLPKMPKIVLNAQVCWKQPGRLGIRFDRSNEREKVRKWIENYLEIQ